MTHIPLLEGMYIRMHVIRTCTHAHVLVCTDVFVLRILEINQFNSYTNRLISLPTYAEIKQSLKSYKVLAIVTVLEKHNLPFSDQFQHLANQSLYDRPNFLFIFNGTAV